MRHLHIIRLGDIGEDQREYEFEPLTAPSVPEPVHVPTPDREAVPVGARFMAHANTDGECWEWTARVDRYGYGRFRLDRKMELAHRVAYRIFVGDIPEGLTVDHLCRNRKCVNPAHLEAVSRKDNTLRGVGPTAVNAGKDVCASGHPFNADNTYFRPTGNRDCRACGRVRSAAYKARRLAVPA
jgi:hypothetical protein